MNDAIFLALATGLAALAQTVAGFGFALIAVPLLVMVLSVPDAVSVAALLSSVNAGIVAWQSRAHIPWKTVRRLVTGSVCALPLGLALLLGVSGDWLRIGVGAITLLMTFALAQGLTLRASGRAGVFGVGFAAGLLTTSIAINGPPVVLFLQARALPRAVFRGAVSAFLVVNSLFSLSLFTASGVIGWSSLPLFLTGLPALFVGNALGTFLVARVSELRFRRLVLALLVLGSVLALADGLGSLFG